MQSNGAVSLALVFHHCLIDMDFLRNHNTIEEFGTSDYTAYTAGRRDL